MGQPLPTEKRDAEIKFPTEKLDAEIKFETEIANLLQNNPDVNKIKDGEIAILGWAVHQNYVYVDAVKTLLKNGADPNIRVMKGVSKTALFSTITSEPIAIGPRESQRVDRSKTIAELLIKHGAYVNYLAAAEKYTPLHEAALQGRTDLCELFIQNGAEVDALDKL